MTVYELIQHLANYPPSTPVLVDGYEDGYTDPTLSDLALVDRGEDWEEHSWWSGRYDRENDDSEGPSFRALVLKR